MTYIELLIFSATISTTVSCVLLWTLPTFTLMFFSLVGAFFGIFIRDRL